MSVLASNSGHVIFWASQLLDYDNKRGMFWRCMKIESIVSEAQSYPQIY